VNPPISSASPSWDLGNLILSVRGFMEKAWASTVTVGHTSMRELILGGYLKRDMVRIVVQVGDGV
jgi:hypothetical protein